MGEDWPEAGVQLVQALADTKLVLSQRCFEWLLAGPSLEDDIGHVSIGQDELGHARQLVLQLEKQGLDGDRLRGAREPGEFASCSVLDESPPDWPTFVVRAAVTDRAAWYLLDAIQHEDLTGLVRRMGEDEWFHLSYWDARLRALADDDRDRLGKLLADALPHALALLGPADHTADADPLVAAGFTDRPARELRDAFLAHLDDLLADAGVPLDDVDRDAPTADGWDPARRRMGEGSLSPKLVATLQGRANEEFTIR